MASVSARVLFAGLALAVAGGALAQTYSNERLRVSVVGNFALRLEERGPKGFEDRPTFHVVDRGDSAKAKPLPLTSDTNYLGYRIRIKQPGTSLGDIEISDPAGNVVWRGADPVSNSIWLPGPNEAKRVIAFADKPRIAEVAKNAFLSGASPDQGWDFSNDAPDVYVFLPMMDYRAARHQFLKLTGKTEMPPLFLFGAIHSRYHPYSHKDVLDLIAEYRKRDFPLDTFVIDTDWRIGASIGYDANTKLFPDLAGLLQTLHRMRIRTMFNDHPEPQSPGANDLKELNYRSEGLSRWLKAGLDVWWYDRNWGISLKSPSPNLRHEVWGMRLYRDITESVNPTLRPAIMANVDGIDNGIRNRAPDVAAHRFPIQWTGDQGPTWAYLRRGVENAVYSGTHAAFPYMSEDLGGHTGHPRPDVFTRFYQYGALSPTMRLHYTAGLPNREPWAWGKEIESICRDYAWLRYRLTPTLYAAARQNWDYGDPILRPTDESDMTGKTPAPLDQYLLGSKLLVAPIVDGDDFRPVPPESLSHGSNLPGLAATYFTNSDAKGEASWTGVDRAVDFQWGDGGPSQLKVNDHFSCVWSGSIVIPGDGEFRVGTISDDGIRLWVDDKLVSDHWVPQWDTERWAPMRFKRGKSYRIRLEYMELTGGASCRLIWQPSETALLSKRPVELPEGTWTDLWTGRRFTGPTNIEATATLRQTPMYVKAGAIFALSPAKSYFDLEPWKALTVEAFAGEGNAYLYEDDQRTQAYKGTAFRQTLLSVSGSPKERVLYISVGKAQGSFEGATTTRQWTFRAHLPMGTRRATLERASINEKPVTARWIESKAGRFPLQLTGSAADGPVVEAGPFVAQVNEAVTLKLSFR